MSCQAREAAVPRFVCGTTYFRDRTLIRTITREKCDDLWRSRLHGYKSVCLQEFEETPALAAAFPSLLSRSAAHSALNPGSACKKQVVVSRSANSDSAWKRLSKCRVQFERAIVECFPSAAHEFQAKLPTSLSGGNTGLPRSCVAR